MTDRFLDNGDGTVTDTQTGLMWEKGPGPEMPWQEAIGRCRDLNLVGHDDWRLPTDVGLCTIVDHGRHNPACDPIFGAVSDSYWSSTTYRSSPSLAGLVAFDDGLVGATYKNNGYRVRAVRGGLTTISHGHHGPDLRYSIISTGWICPRCGGGVAPTATTCPCVTTPPVTV